MNTVLVALHYQNEVLHPGGRIKVAMAEDAQNRDIVIERAGRLLACARANEIPVVSVRIAFRPDHADVIQNCKIFRDVVAAKAMVDGGWGAEFHEALRPHEGEYIVKHTRVNAFYGSQLAEILGVLKAERLIVAGVATSSVVISTVACAADMGYEIMVAADACSSANPQMHLASLEIMRLVADVTDVEDIISHFES